MKEPTAFVGFRWPISLKIELQDIARRRSVRARREVSLSEVALQWVLLGKQHAPPEPLDLPPMPEVGP